MTFSREGNRQKAEQAARDLIEQARVIASTSDWTAKDVRQVLITTRVLNGYARTGLFGDRLNMHIGDAVLSDIDALAEDRDITRSEWIRRALGTQIAYEDTVSEKKLATSRAWRSQASDGHACSVTVKLGGDLRDEVAAHAERRAMSMSSWMVEACKAQLDQYGRLKAEKTL